MPAPPTATMECRLCGEPAAVEILNLGQQPLANKYPTKAEFAAEDFFPLQVFFCPASRTCNSARSSRGKGCSKITTICPR